MGGWFAWWETGNAGMRTLLAVLLTVSLLAGCDEQAGRFGRGMQAFVEGNYETAYARLEPLAVSGYAPAQFRVGLMHAHGLGVPRDAERAVYWYRQAASQGEAAAQYYLASMYLSGDGVRRDAARAARWLRLLARRDYAPAQYRLGTTLRDGAAGAQHAAEAVRWIREAADNGYAPARRALAGLEDDRAPER